MGKKVRFGLAGLFIVVIIVMTIVVYVNRDIFFKNTVKLEYPDGCVEVYEDGKMTTSECTNGRQMIKEEENKTIGHMPPGI